MIKLNPTFQETLELAELDEETKDELFDRELEDYRERWCSDECAN